jgi:hypothetical protein
LRRGGFRVFVKILLFCIPVFYSNLGHTELLFLHVVLYGCETWSLTLREEPLLRVFENSVLSIIFRPKGDKVTGEWTKLHKEELSDLNSPSNYVRVIKSRKMR